ncbi:MAG: N-6 DNA methylase [Clostridiales bacterium]|nr:N-6 DNA methylase [Clostridiales bacterium]
MILSGSGYEGGKQRIVDYYFQDHTNTEKAAFLKDEYGTGGGTVVFSESRRGYQGHNAKGIEIHNSGFDNSSIHLTWSKVSKRIGELIENEKYFQQRYPSDIPIIKPNIVDNTEIQGAEEAPFLMDENITEPETNTAEKKRKTQPEMNFSRLQKLAPHIMDKRYSYSKLQSDGFMDLSIEWIGENKLAMSHYGKQNGDLMADPDMTMIIDFEKKTLMPATFQNDYVGVYQEVYLENNQWRPKLSKELTSFLSTWLKNIEHQGHVLRFAKYYQEEMQSIPVALNGEGQEYGFDIPHDIISLAQLEPYRKAQNARKAKIPIEDELKYEPSFGELGNGITVWNTLEEVDGDYQTIAHIGEDGTITYYVDDLPKAIIERIEKNATPSIPDKQQEMVEYGYQWEGMINLDDEEAIRLFDAGHDIYLLHDDNTESLCESEKRLIQHINDGGLVGLEKEVASIAINNTRQSEKLNFHITDDSLGAVGIKEKYKNNIAAIRLLKIIEGENRLATSDEQEVLSQYVGWGGLSKVFDETDNSWSNEYAELKGILDDTEYKAARSSVLSAYYTPPIVIKSMYKAIENMGFSDGNILEPAMGIGNFMGLLPLSLSDSNMYGVELDSISGRMAKQLYQRENIQVTGLEHTAFHDNFFDVAIGNVPFGSYGVTDKRYDKHNFMIHDYFMAKALDKVRPGGIVAFITSKGTLDKKNSSVRKYLAQRAELVGAIRLPNNAFKANAGTEVTSDIIFLKKRDSIQDIEPDWVQLGTTWDGLPINQYFADNPHMILGTLKKQIGMYGAEDITCIPFEGSNLENQLAEAITHIHAEIEENEYMIDEPETHDTSIPADPNVKNYSFTIMDDKLYYRENSRMNPVDTNVKAEQRIRGMLGLSKTLHLLIDYQLEGYAEHAIIGMQSKLNEQYDNFVKELGRISERGNSLAFSDDSSYYLLTSLENYDDNGQFKNKADIFTKQTIRPNKIIKKVDTASEALAVSIGRKAKVDIGFMSSLTNKESQQIINDLQGIIFKDPLSDLSSPYEGFLAADEYLSGDVRDMTCPT